MFSQHGQCNAFQNWFERSTTRLSKYEVQLFHTNTCTSRRRMKVNSDVFIHHILIGLSSSNDLKMIYLRETTRFFCRFQSVVFNYTRQ